MVIMKIVQVIKSIYHLISFLRPTVVYFIVKDFLIYAIYNVQYTYECMENSKSTKKFVFVDNLGSRYMQISTLKRFMVHF